MYGHYAPFQTRWNDNDAYGHVNNAVYYEAMDTTINVWLARAGSMDVTAATPIAVCASSSCQYRSSAAFPEPLEIGLRAGRLGTTSVTWELGIYAADRATAAEPLATGSFVHVFVDRDSRRPVPIPAAIRAAIERELVVDSGEDSATAE